MNTIYSKYGVGRLGLVLVLILLLLGGDLGNPSPVQAAVPLDGACPISSGFRYSNDYHAYRSGNRLHKGNDLFAKRGTAVVAVEDGEAHVSIQKNMGGIVVRLIGRSGTYFYNAHLNGYPARLNGTSFSKTVSVKKGEVIGYVGNTGNARTTPPHLHLGIKPGGFGADKSWVNPFPHLQRWCKSGSSAPIDVCQIRPFLMLGDGFVSEGKGHTRESVRSLQKKMNILKNDDGTPVLSQPVIVDGYYGPETELAVRAVQSFGLSKYGTLGGKPVAIDGKTGSQTWEIVCR